MKRRLPALLVALILLSLVRLAVYRAGGQGAGTLVFQSEPRGIMGTTCKLAVVTEGERPSRARAALESAQAELRRQEALLSTWIESSPMSRFNSAPGGTILEPAEEVLEVLVMARGFYLSSNRAFDITARPLIELWRGAAEAGIVPTADEIEKARAASSWEQIQLSSGEVSKELTSTRVDVDGIAKGFAIDRALEVLERSGVSGAMVDVGGDLRLFGRGPVSELWIVGIRSPFTDRVWAEIQLDRGAVCSSGDYARPLEIGGRRFSHIIDPRTGWPSEKTRAVTVIGPDAVTADAWATALSVLGLDGLELLPVVEDLEAMIVTGSRENHQVHATPGFEKMLVRASFEFAH